MDDSALDYLKWEGDLLDHLDRHGWIKSVETNRNDTDARENKDGQRGTAGQFQLATAFRFY